MQAVSQAFQICRNNTSQDKLDACLLHVSYGCIFISNSRFVAFDPALVLSRYIYVIFSSGSFYQVAFKGGANFVHVRLLRTIS